MDYVRAPLWALSLTPSVASPDLDYRGGVEYLDGGGPDRDRGGPSYTIHREITKRREKSPPLSLLSLSSLSPSISLYPPSLPSLVCSAGHACVALVGRSDEVPLETHLGDIEI